MCETTPLVKINYVRRRHRSNDSDSFGDRKVASRIRVYVSSTISQYSRPHNYKIAQLLEGTGIFDVYLPQTSIPPIHHANLERWAPRYCQSYIDHADMLLLLMDTYGRDCSWEVGYAYHKKTIVGYTTSLSRFEEHREDWMVKYAIDCMITTSLEISRLCKKDGILKNASIYYIKTSRELPQYLLDFYHQKISGIGQEKLILSYK